MNQFVEQPREPLRPLVSTPETLGTCLDSPSYGTGSVALDVEHAHSHRYRPKAYLFRIRCEGAGTRLIDPVALEGGAEMRLGGLVDACSDALQIIHTASQDLPYVLDVGVRPPIPPDTEPVGRLLGAPSIGLATLLETKLDIRLRKVCLADNQAARPLPTSWLIYAALDVDYLVKLADLLRIEFVTGDRTTWAEKEFIHTLWIFSTPPAPRQEPWRRLSGIQGPKHPR